MSISDPVQVDRFKLQDEQYSFPYHYIPYIDSSGAASITRYLSWGLEYLIYMEHVRHTIRQLCPRSLIDVGCGDGVLAGTMSKTVNQVLGVDLSERAIAFAKAFWPLVDFRCMPVQDVEEHFDCAAAIEVMEHIPDDMIPSFVKGVEKLLSPGGYFVVSVPSVVLKLRKKHYRHYTEDILKSQICDNSRSLRLIQAEFVYYDSRYLRMLKTLSYNSYFSVNLPILKRTIWKFAWNNRLHSAKKGHHVVAVFKKAC